jgi:hypothetical protein
MKHLLKMLTLILLDIMPLFGQKMCIATSKFCINPIALRAGVEGSIIAKFDIIGREAKNIKISSANSLSNQFIHLLDSCSVNNIKEIAFLSDKRNCTLTINYIIQHKPLNNSYGELEADTVLNLVFPQYLVMKYNEGVIRVLDSDTLIITDYLPFKPGLAKKSDILVQRIFDNGIDSTIILRNNYPDYEQLIYERSKEFTPELFMGKTRRAKFCFIRFRILRILKSCGFEEVL